MTADIIQISAVRLSGRKTAYFPEFSLDNLSSTVYSLHR